ncbi:hypothetical protein RRG08_026206 [Elysia crispata]|uniref:Uncharacterized protein n=1 Tax=Elysia crispata TaxID=231223 RepID=A0AAE1DDA7_9GAST|nr:hypothetical protein RRG08_026206 [Elysia crispata]
MTPHDATTADWVSQPHLDSFSHQLYVLSYASPGALTDVADVVEDNRHHVGNRRLHNLIAPGLVAKMGTKFSAFFSLVD